jgi:hypothetical protein
MENLGVRMWIARACLQAPYQVEKYRYINGLNCIMVQGDARIAPFRYADCLRMVQRFAACRPPAHGAGPIFRRERFRPIIPPKLCRFVSNCT